MGMDYGSSNLSSEDRLFLSVPPSRPTVAIASYTVVGGRIVASSQGHFPLNGQQLMMQLDSLTSAMMDMDVSMEEEMEAETAQSGQIQQLAGDKPAPDDLQIKHQQQEQQQGKMQQQVQHQFQQHLQHQLLPFGHKYINN